MDVLTVMPGNNSPTATADALPTLCYEVVRHRGHWRVLHLGKHSQPHASQEAAIGSVMKIALKQEAAGRTVTVKLLRTDGQVFDLKIDRK
jgi:hypothetical protein